MKESDEDQNPDPNRDEDPEEHPSGEVRLEPAGDYTLTRHDEAQPQPPGKTIHRRRPMPAVPEKPDDRKE